MTLRTRIYLLVALALGPALGLVAFDHYRNTQTREAEAEQQALQSALLVSAEVEQLLKGFENLARVIGQAPLVQELRQPACDDLLVHMHRNVPGIAWLGIADRSGNILCSSGPSSVQLDERFLRAMSESNELEVGTYANTKGQPQEAALPLGMRTTARGETSFLIAALRLDWLRGHFTNRFDALPKNSSLTIVDRNGTIVLRLPNFDREGQLLRNYDYVVNKPQPGTFRSVSELNADGVARFLGFTPLNAPPRGLAIAVGLPQESQLAEVRNAAIRNYIILGIAAAFAFFAAAAAGHIFIDRPTRNLLGAIDRWRSGDLRARAATPATTLEFEQLRVAFNAMASDLASALQHKDVLLKELSHRVMNSLQMISAMFRLQARSEHDELRSRLEKTAGRIDAVALTYKRMQAIDGVEMVEFASFLEEFCQELSSSVLHNRCVVHAQPVTLLPDQALPLAIIVNELVTNAGKYGKKADDAIKVELLREQDECKLIVRNDGTLRDGYAESDGFGISMIRSLVKQLRGALDVASNESTVTFSVRFPLPRQTGPAD